MRRERTSDATAFEKEDGEIQRLDCARYFSCLRLASCLLCAAGLTVLAREATRPAAESPSWAEPPRLATKPLPMPPETLRPFLRYATAESEPPTRVEAPRWSPATGQREDALTVGGFDEIEGWFLRVTLTDPTPDPKARASLFVTLARRAAEHGLAVLRTGQRGQVDTKFGPFETLEATLGREGSRQCLGFQSLSERAPRLDGWLCGILAQAPEPPAVGCAIDRLSLAEPARPSLEVAFEEAEARRSPHCRSEEVIAKRTRTSDTTGSIAGAATDSKVRPRKSEAATRKNAQARQ